MKFINFLLLVIFLSGCAHHQQINVRNQILSDADTPQHVKEKIINKQISVGMTKKQVIASWGEPCWWCYGTRQSSMGDTWEYNVFGSSAYGAGSGTYLFFDSNGVLKYWSK